MDVIDRAQQREELDRRLALTAALAGASSKGLPACRECGASIAPLRQDMGAVRCIECQIDYETIFRGRR
jgi:RNA polymerase-binding transcription factor DksA